jgi:endonuclease G
VRHSLGHGTGGTDKNGHMEEIGRGRLKVAVPKKLWKVIVVLQRADAEPRRNTRVIAVIMPNNQSVNFEWAKYRVSVKEVEKLTGYTFFPAVPAEVAAALKDKVDEVKIREPRTRPRRDSGKKEPR